MGSFQVLPLQIFSQVLSLSVLLLGPQHNVNISAFNVVPEEFVCMSSLEKHLLDFLTRLFFVNESSKFFGY